MYKSLLDHLIYQHSTLQLKNKFNQSILPYKNANPIIIVNNNVFEIKCYEYSLRLDFYKNNTYNFKKDSLLQETHYKAECLYCLRLFDFNEQAYIINENMYQTCCCIDCYQYYEYGSIDSIYPILSDYNLMNKGYMKLVNVGYFFNNKKLILSYVYNNYNLSLHININNLSHCSLERAKACINQTYTDQCLICNNDHCLSCSYILYNKLLKFYYPLFICINNLNLCYDVQNIIKNILIMI